MKIIQSEKEKKNPGGTDSHKKAYHKEGERRIPVGTPQKTQKGKICKRQDKKRTVWVAGIYFNLYIDKCSNL